MKFTYLFRYWLPLIIWVAFLFYLSSRPGDSFPEMFPGFDKIAHLGLYAALGFLCVRPFRLKIASVHPHTKNFGVGVKKDIFFATAFSFIYGMTDEWHQSFVAGRDASGFDLASDLIGAFLGAMFYFWLRRKIYGKNSDVQEQEAKT